MNAVQPLLSPEDLAMLIARFGFRHPLDEAMDVQFGLMSQRAAVALFGYDWEEFLTELLHGT